MRMTQQQLQNQLMVMQDIFDIKTYEYFRTITNMLTLSLYEFNRIKKITPLNVTEDVIIIDEFNLYPDEQVEASFRDLLRKFKFDIYPEEFQNKYVDKFTRIIEKYNQDHILRKLTAWHYILISSNDKRKDIIAEMICNYIMKNIQPNYEDMFVIKGNMMTLNEDNELFDEDAMMINYMVKRGVVEW